MSDDITEPKTGRGSLFARFGLDRLFVGVEGDVYFLNKRKNG